MAAKKKILKPGEDVPVSGQYAEITSTGKKTGQEITGVKGKTLPPTQKKRRGYILVDKTK